MYVAADKISKFSIECFTKVGMKEEEAKLVTETLLLADSRGIHSHGFVRLPIYIERIKKGFINVNAYTETIKDSNSMTLMNGNHGAGQVVGKVAMDNSIRKAKEMGLGLTIVKNSNHFGIAAYYSALAAQHNMIGIAISNTEPLIPAAGGAEKVIGNNPVSIAAPSTSGEDPIILDMALSNVAVGKIIVARTKGESIPKGWGADKNGVETQNPEEVLKDGLFLPIGGHKGFGLALLTEILTGVISGGEKYSKINTSLYDLEENQSISFFMMAIDLSFFINSNDYSSRIANITSFVRDSKKAPGVDQLFLPGEKEFQNQKQNKNKGIPIDESIIQELINLGKNLDVSFDL